MLTLHNSFTRRREPFVPIDPEHVRVYACGPTVYSVAHLGNARAAVCMDVLIRLLRSLFPRVTYVRNVTDVDDKINADAAATGEPIGVITARTLAGFHADMDALGNARPIRAWRAAGFVEPGEPVDEDGARVQVMTCDPDARWFSRRCRRRVAAGR